MEIEKYTGVRQLIYHQLQPVQLPDHLSIAIGSHGFLHFLANCKTGYFRSRRNETGENYYTSVQEFRRF